MDQKISDLSERKRDEIRRTGMGFVFQSVALIGLMSAYENVEFALRIAGYDKKKRKERAEECLDFVGLANRMTHRPHELSGGEQQRVAIPGLCPNPKNCLKNRPLNWIPDGSASVEGVSCLVTRKQRGTTLHDPNMWSWQSCLYLETRRFKNIQIRE